MSSLGSETAVEDSDTSSFQEEVEDVNEAANDALDQVPAMENLSLGTDGPAFQSQVQRVAYWIYSLGNRLGHEHPLSKEEMRTLMVDIFVGPNAKKFTIHRALLRNKVETFDRRLRELESLACPAAPLWLEKQSPTAFSLLVGWLYTDSVKKLCQQDLDGSEQPACVQDRYYLYLMAERYQITDLIDLSMDAFVTTCKVSGHLPNVICAGNAFRWAHPESKFRVFMVRVVAFAIKERRDSTGAGFDQIVAEIITDPILAVHVGHCLAAANFNPQDPRAAPACDYHQHISDIPCSVERRRGLMGLEIQEIDTDVE